MAVRLRFLGGAGTVTGSKYLLECGRRRLLVDCGLFQGYKQLRLRNREPLPVKPRALGAVVLTHAHIDHSGYVPLLVRDGYRGRIVCSPATRDLCAVLLPDSGYLQEKDAEFANRNGFSRHHPALPLYTQADAERSLGSLDPVPFGETRTLAGVFEVRLDPAGHIPGAAIASVRVDGLTIVFSGDLGRPGSPTMVDPAPIRHADYLVVESTYGDTRHDPTDPEDALAAIITRTAGRGGTVLIPAFAVGRTQILLYHLQRLKAAGRIPDLPVFLDSPMAIEASRVFCENAAVLRLTRAQCETACGVAQYVREVEESKALNANAMPKVIVSASGMATGGRVLHHLKHLAPNPANTILFTGFQAGGTRGDKLVRGAATVKIHGEEVPVRAEIDNLQMLSAHADADEIMGWLANFAHPPRRTFVTHGEPAAADALRYRIEHELGWDSQVPDHRDTATL